MYSIPFFLLIFLQRKDVQTAIHASIPYAWSDCSPRVHYNYSDVEKSVIPLYHQFLESGDLRMLVYSGDVDAIVPITGTRHWISHLKLPVVKPWRSWIVNQQVGQKSAHILD